LSFTGDETEKMKLRAEVDDLDTVQEAYREAYTKVGDRYELNVTGIDAHSRVKAIVSKRDEVISELKSLKKKFSDIDVDEYEKLKSEREEREKNGDPTEAVKTRLEAQHTKAIGKLEANLNGVTELAHDLLKAKHLDGALEAAGVSGDYMKGARALVLLENIGIVGEGKDLKVVHDPDGAQTPVAEWIKDSWAASDEAKPYLAGSGNQGSGAKGAKGGGGGGGGSNPWAKDSFNLTEQGRIMKESPTQAQKLMAAAGAAGWK